MNSITMMESYLVPFTGRHYEEKMFSEGLTELNWQLGAKYERLIYILIAFRKSSNQNYGTFNNIDIKNIKVDLDTEVYPKDQIECDFKHLNAGFWYNEIKKFQRRIYCENGDYEGELFSERDFSVYYPIFVIDLLKQDKPLKFSRPQVTITANLQEPQTETVKCCCLFLYNTIVTISSDGNKLTAEK